MFRVAARQGPRLWAKESFDPLLVRDSETEGNLGSSSLETKDITKPSPSPLPSPPPSHVSTSTLGAAELFVITL